MGKTRQRPSCRASKRPSTAKLADARADASAVVRAGALEVAADAPLEGARALSKTRAGQLEASVFDDSHPLTQLLQGFAAPRMLQESRLSAQVALDAT